MLDAALAQAGYKRLTGAAATTDRTFETSDDYDVPIGSLAFDRTLKMHSAQRLNAQCWQAYKTNPIIWGMTELVVRATAGKNCTIKHNKLGSDNSVEKAQAEKIQALLERWWYQPENNWPLLCEQIQRDMLLFGELIPILPVNSLTGEVIVGFIDVNAIKEIKRDKLNMRRVTGIVVKLDDGKERELKLIQSYDGSLIAPEGDAIPEWFAAWQSVNGSNLIGRNIGEVFYWTNNTTLASVRGQGDFAQVIDPATDAIKIVRGIADKLQINNRVHTEVVFPESWTQEQINNALNPSHKDYIHPPRFDDNAEDNRICGHTKEIELKPFKADIGASDNSEVFKMCLALVSSGSNIPLHWMGWADELTYASAKDISNIPNQYLKDRQNSLRKFVTDATDFQIDQWRIFTHELDGIDEALLYDYSIEMPMLDARTLEQVTGVLRDRMNAIGAAKQYQLIDDERAKAATEQVLRDGGINA